MSKHNDEHKLSHYFCRMMSWNMTLSVNVKASTSNMWRQPPSVPSRMWCESVVRTWLVIIFTLLHTSQLHIITCAVTDRNKQHLLGSCESFFCVWIESGIESAVYTTQAVTPSNELQGAPCRRTVWAYMLTTSVVNEYLILIHSIGIYFCLLYTSDAADE